LRLDVPDSLRPTLRAAMLLGVVFLAGTAGFAWLGGPDHGWLDAFYMTTITLTTVGFEEAIPVLHRPGAQIFTIALLLVGAGAFVYFVSNLTAFLVEGTFERFFWRRRMMRRIAELSEHFVVCGGGRTGEHVVSELLATERPFVLVERDGARIAQLQAKFGDDLVVVEGDATEDDVLAAAAVERARGLLLCTNNDKDNLVAIFTARSLNPAIRIVARCGDERLQHKLERAGANSVVSPDRIGGLRLISEMVRPTVVGFLDHMMRDPKQHWRIEEVAVGAASSLDGSTVGAVRARAREDLLLVAVHEADGRWRYNPADGVVLGAGMGLVFMASPEARAELESAARAGRAR
jgi:voltage-gated potassium channel